jgi:ornithine carbamoyltransferase
MHFLDGTELTRDQLTSLLDRALALKGAPAASRALEGRSVALRDTALVLSRHVAAIGLRTGDEEQLTALAEHATVPVVNMLSPLHHPCQAPADLIECVLYGDRQRIWDQAENRRHAQKALLELLVSNATRKG